MNPLLTGLCPPFSPPGLPSTRPRLLLQRRTPDLSNHLCHIILTIIYYKHFLNSRSLQFDHCNWINAISSNVIKLIRKMASVE